VCDKNHRHSISWNSFQQGARCAYCDGKVVTHEQVEKAFKSSGYALLSKYENSREKLEFICDKNHRSSVSWASWQQGKRCAHCSTKNYKPNLPGTLYYVRFDLPSGIQVYKIGVTNRTVQRRHSVEPTPYKIIWQQKFDDGQIPWEMEQDILVKYKEYQYKGNELRDGNTECFTHDVLGYDNPTAKLDQMAA
jgi:hypothetical protein